MARTVGRLYWSAVVFAGAALVLVVANIVLMTQNQGAQAEVNQRQQFINQTIQLNQVTQTLVRLIATAAVNNNDEKLRELLVQEGFTVTVNPAAPAAPAAPATAPAPAGGEQKH